MPYAIPARFLAAKASSSVWRWRWHFPTGEPQNANRFAVLDEGFGTLDSETLDTALDALDALNATGKTIGVISHVEAMKERIPVQIKVKKINGLGYSRLDKEFAVQ